MADVKLLHGRTVYERVGDWPVALVALLLLIVAGFTARRGRRRRWHIV
jgi:apolipoprotein N-acyltransferase